jgi:hypothetical protein
LGQLGVSGDIESRGKIVAIFSFDATEQWKPAGKVRLTRKAFAKASHEIWSAQETEMVVLRAGGDWNRVHAIRDKIGVFARTVRPPPDIGFYRRFCYPIALNILCS